MAGVEIRAASASEACALTELAQAAKAHWGYEPSLLDLWAPQLTLTPDYICAHDVWVASMGDGAVGFYALESRDSVMELEHLWVNPRWMGQGIGRALFEHAVLRARAACAVQLRVVSDPNAERFYLRMGARRVGQQESTPKGRQLPVLLLDLAGGPSL